MNRNELAQKVVREMSFYGYPFGGYLRDGISGEDFTDVDIFMPAHDSAYTKVGTYRLQRALMSAGLIVELSDHKRIYNKSTGMQLEKDTYQITDPDSGASIKVDVVRNKGVTSSYQDHPFTSLDADVNALWFNKITGKLEVASCMSYLDGYTVEEICNNIRQRVFNIPEDVEINTSRIKKLMEKGYSPKEAKVKRKSWDATDYVVNQHITQAPPEKDSENIMTQTRLAPPTFMDQFKSDMEKAAYRSTGEQMTNGAKQGILAMLRSSGADEGVLAFIAKMLDTEGGTAVISAMLGHGLPHAPMIGTDPRIVRLCEEFRVAGYAQGMNLLFAAMFQYVLPGVLAAMQSLPPVTASDMAELTNIQNSKVRVAGHEPTVPDLSFLAEKEAEAEMEPRRKQTRTA